MYCNLACEVLGQKLGTSERSLLWGAMHFHLKNTIRFYSIVITQMAAIPISNLVPTKTKTLCVKTALCVTVAICIRYSILVSCFVRVSIIRTVFLTHHSSTSNTQVMLRVETVVFLSLVLDLFAFTIPLPLFPRLIEWYTLVSLSRYWNSKYLKETRFISTIARIVGPSRLFVTDTAISLVH